MAPPYAGKGADLFISVWNLHRSPHLWERPTEFDPTRYDRPYSNTAFEGKWGGFDP